MKVILFGATGMVGQGVLRECLAAGDVEQVLSIGRTPLELEHAKLRQLTLPDPGDLEALTAPLSGFDACFFCLGISSAGMTEVQYTRTTYDLTLKAASTLARLNPQMTFTYVSGRSTDGSEQGKSMWARVKGRTENALQRLPFKAAYMFRPGVIRPLHGIRSKTAAYQVFYSAARPLLWAMGTFAPNSLLSTESIGLAMLAVARHGAPKTVLEVADIHALLRERK